MSTLAKSTFITTILNLCGIVFSFLSSLVIARVFGAGREMDVYFAATAVPLFLTVVFVSSLSVIFLPVFTEYKNKEKEDVWKIVSSILNIGVGFTLLLSLLLIALSLPLMKFLTPGFDDGKIILSADLLRWFAPVVVLTLINEMIASIYYSHNQFIIPLLNKVISPAITIVFVVLFSSIVNVKSIIWASLAGMFVQTLLLTYQIHKRIGFRYYFIFDYQHVGVKKVFKLIGPIILGALTYRIIPIFDRYIASQLREGDISYLGYSFKLYSQLPSIISTGITLSIFPLLSQLAIEADWNKLRTIMSKAMRMVLFLSIPITVVLFLFGDSVIKLFFQRGAFKDIDTYYTSRTLAFYILALPIAVFGDILSKGYYVLQDTKTPMLIGIIEIVVYFSSVYILLPYIDFLAIPVSYAIYYNFSAINIYFVRKKIGNTGGKTIFKSAIKYLLSAIISSGICFIVLHFIEDVLSKNIVILFSLILYFGINRFVFRTQESIVLSFYFKKLIHI